jgi:RNA polymerase sigma factor (sigma-70 family)
MRPDYKDDLNLATRVVHGDAGAFDDFYARYADLVFAFIYHLLNGARADAEDIWQDTFIVAVRALSGYRGQSLLSSWLCGIARHKVADFQRRKGGTSGVISPLPPKQLLELMDGGLLPDEILQQGITRARIVEALAGQPDRFLNRPICQPRAGRRGGGISDRRDAPTTVRNAGGFSGATAESGSIGGFGHPERRRAQ